MFGEVLRFTILSHGLLTWRPGTARKGCPSTEENALASGSSSWLESCSETYDFPTLP